MNIDDMLRETLRDDRYALPGWPDATARVRAGMARRRRHRAATVLLATVATVLVVTAGAFAARLPWRGVTPAGPHPSHSPAVAPSPGQLIPWSGRIASAPPTAAGVPRDANLDVTAGIDVASTVDPGSDLTYIVVLDNRSDRDLSLDPCPVLTQSFGGDGGTYQFACTVPTVPAHSWLRIQMRLSVSAAAPAGVQTLSWTLATPNGPLATATATLTVR